MNNISWKWLAMLALVVALFVTGKANVTLGGTDAQTGQPSAVVVPAPDSGEAQVDRAIDGLFGTVPQLLSTAALGGLVALLLNLGKLIPGAAGKLDGKTGTITTIINIVAFIAITAAGYFGYADRVRSILEQTGNAIPAMLGLVTAVGGVLSALGGSSLTHELMKKINVTAFSFSARPITAPQGG